MDSPAAFPTRLLNRRPSLIAIIALGVCLLAAYANSFRVPFVFDDLSAISENLAIRDLRTALTLPPNSGITTAGRPMVSLSLAVNYAFGGLDVRGYHAANLLIHFLAALALFGVVRRTLLLPRLRERFAPHAPHLALATTLLWAAHPLQTESVTYVVQRAESIVGLFYLLTFYCFLRAVADDGENPSPSPRAFSLWTPLAVAACLLGMASKEVMASAPLLVLLFDRTFVSGSFSAAWRTRRNVHLALAATWVVLAVCILSTGNRGGTVGFGGDVSIWRYALTQCWAIPHYLRLVFWPHPLVLDYGTALFTRLNEVLLPGIFLLSLLAGTVVSLRLRPAVGFLGALFFCVLAPSSSVVPVVSQTVAEHRMYLALAPVVALVVLLLYRWLGWRTLFAWPVAALAFVGLTHHRNHDYRTELNIWEDIFPHISFNARAWTAAASIRLRDGDIDTARTYYARALELSPNNTDVLTGQANLAVKTGRTAEAIAIYENVLRVKADSFEASHNLGKLLLERGQLDAALAHLGEAVRLKPDAADPHYNLGNALVAAGRAAEAVAQFEAALRIEPASIDARNNLGLALASLGRNDDALASFQAAVRLAPDSAPSHLNLGRSLSLLGRTDAGRAAFEHALRLDPSLAEARANLASALMTAGRLDEAAQHYRAALAAGFDNFDLRLNLGKALVALERNAEAIPVLERAAALSPASSEAHYVLANALAGADRLDAAAAHFEKTVQLAPAAAEAWNNYGIVLARLGRLREARARFEQALRVKPDYQEARDNLARAISLDKP